MPQQQVDPFFSALDDVRRGSTSAPGGDPFLAALDDVRGGAAGMPPKDQRSSFARAVDVALTPVVSPERARQVGGEIAGAGGAFAPLPERGFLGTLRDVGGALADLPGLLLREPVATIRGGLGGMVEGAATLSDPLTIATTLTGGGARAIRPALVRALRALPDAERAILAARASGNVPEIVRLRAEIQSLRSAADIQAAISRALRGVEVGSGAALAGRGVERVATAETLPEAGAGLAQVAFGALGAKTAAPVPGVRPRVPLHAGELPAARGFSVTPDGAAIPAGADVPMTQAADGSFVRSVPAEPARHEVRGLLPPGPRFVAPESGPAGPLESAAAVAAAGRKSAQAAAGAESYVRSRPAAVAAREFEGKTETGRVYSSDPNAVDVPKLSASDDEARELRRMLEEMRAVGFTKHTFNETTGRGGGMEIVPGSAGAPVFSDVVQVHGAGNPSRADVIGALQKAVNGEHSALGQSALNVARLRLARSPRVSRPILPPDAGTVRGEIPDVMIQGGRVVEAPGGGRATAGEDEGFESFASLVDDMAAEGGEFGPGEFGGVSPQLLARTGGGVTGAAIGAATGEDTEDRIKRGLLYGAAGFAAPSLLRSSAGRSAAVQAGSVVSRESVPRVPLRSQRAGEKMADPLAGIEPFISKFPEEMRAGLRRTIADNSGFEAQRRGTIPRGTVERLSQQIAVDVSAKLPPGTALNGETIKRFADTAATLQSKLNRLAARVTAGANTEAELIELAATKAQYETVLASLMGARSEAGRALSTFNMLANVLRSGDVSIVRDAARALGEDAAKLAQQLAALPDDPIVRYKFLQAEAQKGATVGDKLRSYYYSSILSGLKTHERNAIGNLANTLSNLALKPVAAAVDVSRAAATGRPREVFLSEWPSEVVGAMRGLHQGFGEFAFAMKYGAKRDALTGAVTAAAEGSKFDVPRIEFKGGGVNPLNWPGRLLDSSDVLFRSIARVSELSAAAHAQAKREGLKGPAFDERMASLMVGDDEIARKIQAQADTFATRAVYQEKAGPIAGLVQAASRKFPPLSFVVPFVKTPANIFRQGFEYSPAGFVMKAAQREGRAGVQAQARAAAGSMLLAPLAYLASTGQLSGSGPRDAAERARLMKSGWRPNSVKVGDKWVAYALFQPISVPAGIVANAFEQWNAAGADEKSLPEIWGRTLSAALRSGLDQSFLSGLNDFLAAIDDPERFGSAYVGRAAHSLTPFAGAQRSITSALDPVVRQPQTAAERVRAQVPGLSESVPARLDPFGEEITREGGPIRRLADPFNVSTETHDPVVEELHRLGVSLSVPRVELKRRGAVVPLTREQEQAIKISSGRMVRMELAQAMGGQAYSHQPEETQRRKLERAISKARATVRARALGRLSKQLPLTAEALMQRADTPRSEIRE